MHRHRNVVSRDARRGRDDPANVAVVSVPELDVNLQVRRDVVQVRVGQLAQQLVGAEIELR